MTVPPCFWEFSKVLEKLLIIVGDIVSNIYC